MARTITQFKPMASPNLSPSIAALGGAARSVQQGFETLRATMEGIGEAREKEQANKAIMEGLSKGLTTRDQIQTYAAGLGLRDEAALKVVGALNKDLLGDRQERAAAIKESTDALFGSLVTGTSEGQNPEQVLRTLGQGKDPLIVAQAAERFHQHQKEMDSMTDRERAQVNFHQKTVAANSRAMLAAGQAAISKAKAALSAQDPAIDPAMMNKVGATTDFGGNIRAILGPQIDSGLLKGPFNWVAGKLQGAATGDEAIRVLESKKKELMGTGQFNDTEATSLLIQAIQMSPDAHDLAVGTGIKEDVLKRDLQVLGDRYVKQKTERGRIAQMEVDLHSRVAAYNKKGFEENMRLVDSFRGIGTPTPTTAFAPPTIKPTGTRAPAPSQAAEAYAAQFGPTREAAAQAGPTTANLATLNRAATATGIQEETIPPEEILRAQVRGTTPEGAANNILGQNLTKTQESKLIADTQKRAREEELKKAGGFTFPNIFRGIGEAISGLERATSSPEARARLVKATGGKVKKDGVSIPESSRLARVNNNPLNLTYVTGKDGKPVWEGATEGEEGFAKFETPEQGIEAGKQQIRVDAGRGHTLNSFIYKFAPPIENDTEGYIDFLKKELNITGNPKLSDIDPEALLKAMAQMESGTTIN